MLAYHTALSLHGIAQSLQEERVSLSAETMSRSFRFRGVLCRTLPPPKSLPGQEALSCGVETMDRQGMHVRVSSIERTIVDAFDRLRVCGGWEEVWRSLQGLDVYLDFPLITRYATMLDNATTAAKVGFFLESQRERLRVPDSMLTELKQRSPKQPHYVERTRRCDARLISGWNLFVPTNLDTSSHLPEGASEEEIPI